MKLVGEELVPLPIAKVWEGLNDPAILQQCIPGCEEIVRVDDSHYTIRLLATVGPVRVKFAGALETRDMCPPDSYSLVFEGKGGAAGFAKGTANVNLVAQADSQTLLRYDVDAQIGGKLAQIGGRLIDSVAAKTAEAFFASFTNTVVPAVVPSSNKIPPATDDPTERAALFNNKWLFGGGFAVILAIVYYVFS